MTDGVVAGRAGLRCWLKRALVTAGSLALLLQTQCVRFVAVETLPAYLSLASPFQLVSQGAHPIVSEDRRCMLLELELLEQLTDDRPRRELTPRFQLLDAAGRAKDVPLACMAFAELPFPAAGASDIDQACAAFTTSWPQATDCTGPHMQVPAATGRDPERKLYLWLRWAGTTGADTGNQLFPSQLRRGDALRFSIDGIDIADLRLVTQAGPITSFVVGAGLVFAFTVVVL